jgi:hypothetical protein
MTFAARFVKPWIVREQDDGFVIVDQRGVYICGLCHREDLHQAGWTLADRYLSKEEARYLAEAISKIE